MPDMILDAIPKLESTFFRFTFLNWIQCLDVSEKPDSDAKILWRINWIRVERYLRDEAIISAFADNEALDTATIQVAQLVFKVGEVKSAITSTQSNPISVRYSSSSSPIHLLI